ncbi:MAG: tetratricopeptide repeat protein [bacterium]|nr:tetratricopeptide repeat protein [bacterium]
MRSLTTVLLTLLLLSPSLAAGQEPAPAPDAQLQTALEKLATGDFEGAIAILEPMRESGEAPDQVLATLGALYVEIGLLQDALDVLGPLAVREDANPAVLFNAGRAAVELGEDERGEEYLRRSVRAQPVSPAARLLGIRLGARGQLVASYQLLRPWALANPGDVEARLAAAVSALRLERVPEAGELLEGLPGDNPRVRLLRADHALQRREPAAALELLEPIADDHPPEMTVDVTVLLATAYLELGRSADAVARLRERGGDHPKLALTLAQALYQGGDVESALRALTPFAEPLISAESAKQVPPAMQQLAASVVLEQGRLLLAAERLPEAVTALERAAELGPWSDETWQELARAHALAGDTDKAREATARLQEIAAARERSEVPGMAGRKRLADPTGRRLAEALEWLERGEADQALATVRQEIALAGDDVRPRLLEVRILLQLERREEALASVEAALELFPDHPDALHFRAVVLLSRGNAEAAEADLRRALELAAGHVPAMNDLALVLAGKGEREEARRLLEKVLELAPGDPLATQRLAALEADGK